MEAAGQDKLERTACQQCRSEEDEGSFNGYNNFEDVPPPLDNPRDMRFFHKFSVELVLLCSVINAPFCNMDKKISWCHPVIVRRLGESVKAHISRLWHLKEEIKMPSSWNFSQWSIHYWIQTVVTFLEECDLTHAILDHILNYTPTLIAGLDEDEINTWQQQFRLVDWSSITGGASWFPWGWCRSRCWWSG